jgi:hypothetical protein
VGPLVTFDGHAPNRTRRLAMRRSGIAFPAGERAALPHGDDGHEKAARDALSGIDVQPGKGAAGQF